MKTCFLWKLKVKNRLSSATSFAWSFKGWCYFWDNFLQFSIKTNIVGTQLEPLWRLTEVLPMSTHKIVGSSQKVRKIMPEFSSNTPPEQDLSTPYGQDKRPFRLCQTWPLSQVTCLVPLQPTAYSSEHHRLVSLRKCVLSEPLVFTYAITGVCKCYNRCLHMLLQVFTYAITSVHICYYRCSRYNRWSHML